MPDEPILKIEDVTVDFKTPDGPLRALENVSLSLDEGEFLCVVGSSGCGKTTLMNLVAGFQPPTDGRVVFEGEEVLRPSQRRGMVFQSPSLYPWLTVRENVEFGPRMCGVPRKERRRLSEKHLHLVKLWDVRAMRPYELSGGMQQRVAVARVLANDSHLLLMDEPLGALDALTREHMQDELLRLWREMRKTFFFITHDVEEAIYLATTIIVMSPRPGRIIETIHPPFSREGGQRGAREIKSSPEFVEMREQVLRHIWGGAV